MPGKDKEYTWGDRLRSFDFYKDLPKELSEPSMSGASSKMLRRTYSVHVCSDTAGSALYILVGLVLVLLEDI